MILDKFSAVFCRESRFKSVISLLSFCLLLSVASITSAADKNYLRLEKNKESDLNDLDIKSIGALIFDRNLVGHLDLISRQSDVIGDSWALDFGGGYVFSGTASLYLGVGISLDYNLDTDDFNDQYYSEAGVVVDVSRSLSITGRMQHFYNQPDDYEEVVMLGLLFRH